MAKLTKQQRSEIVTMYSQPAIYKLEYIAALYGVTREYVCHLALRRGALPRRPQSTKKGKLLVTTAMTHLCERCRVDTELMHCKSVDEYLCEECIMRLATEHYDQIRTNGPTDSKEDQEWPTIG